MQQRGMTSNMENDEGNSSAPQTRGRTNSKLKVLVRSHAMREETSPPRDPAISPSINLIPSPNATPNNSPTTTISASKPVVLLSLSLSRGSSPTSTLVSSPTRHPSTRSHSPEPVETTRARCNGDVLDETMDERKAATDFIVCDVERRTCKVGTGDESGHHNGRRNMKNRYGCDCTHQNCTRCLRVHEKNYNNNMNFNNNNNTMSSPNTLSVTRAGPRGKMRQHSSSQGSIEGSTSNSPCLSRDSSGEQYTDTTGVDLDLFIAETLNRNGKDRVLMLRIEQELVNLAKDKSKTHFKFPPMSSYQRMLVHRCAAYFGMDHNIEATGKCVVVNKTKSTRVPEVEFKEHVKADIVFPEEQRRSILKRDSNSMEDYHFKSPDRQMGLENRRSKSFEEREEEYEKVRRRIFNREMHDFSSAEEFGWSEVPWSSTDSDSSRCRMYPLERGCRLVKVQSAEVANGCVPTRPYVAKSYSFGGYGGNVTFSRDDSLLSTHSAGPRLLTKQDSGASNVSWRLSPSSSGYKSQSQISESVTPSPTSTPNLPGDPIRQDSLTQGNESVMERDVNQLMWAITDMQNIPKGSIIINPQTGQPVKNMDGSIYQYDPLNPPQNLQCSSPPPPPPCHNTQRTHNSPQKHSTQFSPRRSTSSPLLKKSNVTNSSTSPIVQLSPPMHASRSLTFSAEDVPNVPLSQYPVYGSNYSTPPPLPPQPAHDSSMPVFQQPCVVYASYGVPSLPTHYDGRMEPQLQEVPGNFYETPNVPTYQPSPMWNQPPPSLYQAAPSTNANATPRFSMPLAHPPTSFIPTSFTPNYATQQHPIPQQHSQNPDVLPMYQNHQPVQLVYSYPNGGVVYPPNSMYQNVLVPLHYPQGSVTPTSCASFSTPPFDQATTPTGGPNLAQGVSQLSINTAPSTHAHPPVGVMQKNATPRGGKFSNSNRHFGAASSQSQSSTGTNSPATIIAGYNNAQASTYQTPPGTPNMAFGYGPGFAPPLVYRQMSNIRTSPPITNRGSRSSPIPAGDVPYGDRHRFSLPPQILQGMPYVMQNDSRMLVGNREHMNCRQPPTQQQHVDSFENYTRTYKNRNYRGKKVSGLPPSGK